MKEVNSGVQLFSNYVADPAKAGSCDPAELKMLLDQFPYCQLLHLFYTHNLWAAEDAGYKKQLEKAALFIPERSKLAAILKISEKTGELPETAITETVNQEIYAESESTDPESNIEEYTVEEEPELIEVETSDEEEPEEQIQEQDSEHSWDAKKAEEPVEEIREEKKEETVQKKPAESPEDLIENIFNQIIGAIPPPEDPEPVVRTAEVPKAEENKAAEKVQKDERPKAPEAGIENAPEIEISVQKAGPAAAATEQLKPVAEEAIQPAGTDQKVSKYDDDKMPYSFLWWLNKTRKEHSDTYQPYVEFKLDTSQKIKKTSVDQLSSQIIENIFHLQSPLDDLENAPRTVPFQVRHKEDSILEKFIKEEPQIKPPDSHKLDTENKARKSAEDPNDLVSETLAQIYTDQMLFQKAIDTYKKLSLKFPEKSTYFAVQIRELEKKVN